MKDLGKKIRNGGVHTFNASDLGIDKRGKGSLPRKNYMCDPEYKRNFEKIFGKKK